MMRDRSRKIAWPVTRLWAALAALSLVTAMPASVRAQSTVTWTGGGGNGSWGTGGNWGGGSAPTNGSTLVFGSSAATFTTSTNTLSSGSFASLLFNADGSTGFTSGYTLSGNAITLSGSIATTAIGQASDTAITDTLSLPIALTSGGLTVSTGGIHNVTVSGNISGGGGGLTKSGSGGILTLSGTNSYSGVTTASAGVLRFTGTSALYGGDTSQWTSTNLVASSGAILAFNVGGSGQFTTGNIDTILGSTGIASGAIIGIDTTNNSGALSYTPSGLGSRGIAKFGTGKWTFSGTVSSAPIVVDSGTLALTQDNTAVSALTFGAVSRSTAGSVLDLTNASLTSTSLLVQAVGSGTSVITLGNGKTLTTNGNVSLRAPGTGNQFLRFAVSGTGGTWNVSGTSFVVGTADGTLNQERAVADLSGLGTFNANLGSTGLFRIGSNNPFNNGVQQALLTLATNSTITAGTLEIGSNQGPYGGNKLLLGSGTNTINVNSITVGAGGGRANSALTFNGSNGSLTIKAADGASAAALNIMAPFNAFTGSAPSGLFDVSGHAANMLFGTVDIFNNSGANGQGNAYQATFVFDSGTVQATTFNVGRWSGSNVGGATSNNPLASTAFIGGTGAAGGTAITSNNYSATATLGAVTVSNVSANVASGTTNPGMQGFLNIAGNNTSVTMSTLSIALSTSGSAGSGAVNSLGVVTIAGGSVSTTGAVTIATKTAANGATVTGSLAINGGSFKAGGNIVGGGGSSTLSLAGGLLDLGGNSIGGSGTLAISTLSFASGTLQNVAGINAGAGWTMSGVGTLTLAGSNAYTGVTTVSGGTLALGSVNSLVNSTLDTGAVGSQAVTFTVAGTNTYNLGGLQGSNGLAIGGNTISVGANGASTSFGGAISGVGGILAKTGTGTLTLSASNSYSGGTQLNGGVVALGDPGALGSAGAISFGGGTLQFSGTNTTDYSSRFSTANNQAYSLDTNGQSVTLGTALTSTGGSLTKSGSGMLTLTQDATFSGTTTVTGGTLAVGAGGTAGTVAGPIALSNTAALVINRSNDVTLGGIISGTGSLTKQGAGTLTLTAPNTYAGLTTISAGTVALSGGDNRLATGGTVSFAGNGGLSISGSQSLASLTLAATVSATLTGGGTMSLTGASFLVGSTTQNALDASGLASFTSNNAGGTFKVGGQSGAASSAAALVLPATAGITASSILIGNDANNGGGLNSGTVTLGTTTTLSSNTITLGSNQAQGVIRYGSATNPTLTIRGTNGTSAVSSMTIGTSGGYGNTANSLIDLATNVTGSSTLDALVTTLVIGQQTRGLTINQNLTVTGGLVMQSGTLTATTITLGQTQNNPTISGGPQVITGSLSLSGGIVNVGTLYLADQSWSAGTVTGVFRLDGGGTLNAGTIASGTSAGAGATTRTFTWNDGTIANRDASTDLSIGSGIAFTLASTGTHRFLIGTGRSGTMASVMAGAGGTLEKAGAGTLTLTGSNTYTGATTISAGVLALSGAGAITTTGTVAITGSGASFDISNATGSRTVGMVTGSAGSAVALGANSLTLGDASSGTFAGSISGSGGLTKQGAGTLTLSASNSYSGGTQLNGGVVALGDPGALGSAGAISFGGGTLQFSGTNTTDYSSRFSTANNQAYRLDTNGQSVTLGTALTSTGGSLTKSGSGMLTLTQDATFSGTTTVTGGTMALGAGGTAGTVAGPIALSNTAALVVNRSNGVTLGGIISGTGSLTKQGAGTLTLTAPNTYAGLTTISAGTIALSGGDNRLATGGTVSFAGAGGLSISGSQSLASLTLAETVSATLAGGGKLALTGASFLVGGTTQNASQVLDASGLASFISNNAGGTFKVGGQANSQTSAAALVLPATVGITASSILIGNDPCGSGSLNSGTVTLGTTTTLSANTITLGSNQAQGVIRYGSATNPTLTIRGTDGTSAVSSMTIGTSAGYGNTTNSLIDLATNVTGSSTLDALVTNLVIGQGARGSGQSLGGITITGGLLMQSGTLTATTITLGQTQNNPAISGGVPVITGSLSLSGGIVNVGTLYLADQNWSAGTVTGVFRLDGGGTLNAGTIASGTSAGAGATTRTFTWNDGTIANRDASTDLSIGSGIAFTLASTGTHRFLIGTGRSGTMASVMAGAGGTLEKAGAGTLTLTGSNTYTGATTISAGVLSIAGTSALQGTSGLTIAGGAGLAYTGGAATFGKNITVTAGSGTGTITNSGVGLLTLSGNLSKDNSVLRLTGGAFNVTGTISGATVGKSDLLVDGTSSVTLSAANTYNGPTFVIQSSTLAYGITNAIPSNSVVNLGDATSEGTLAMSGYTGAIGGLTFGSAGGTLRLAATSSSAPVLTATSGTMTLTNGTLDLAGSGSTAGLYRVLSAQSISGSFAPGNVNNTPANYSLLYTGTEVNLQMKANQAATFTLTTGTVTRALQNSLVSVSGAITNSSPANAAALSLGLGSTGQLTVSNFITGSVAAGSSLPVSGSINAGSTVGSRTWTVVNTDNNAITTTSTSTGSLTVVADRTFTTQSIAFGRFLNTTSPLSGTSLITSTGSSGTTANSTIGGFGASNGLTLSLGGGTNAFTGLVTTQTAIYTTTGSYSGALGGFSGSFNATATNEFGGTGAVTVAYTGTAVAQRSFSVSNSGTINLGSFLRTASMTGSTSVTSLGSYATTASGTLGAFNGSNTNGFTLTTNDSTAFNGADSQTANYSLSGSASSAGAITGSFTSNVQAELGNINAVTVALVGTAYDAASITKVQNDAVGNGGTISIQNAAGNYRSAAYVASTSVTGRGWSVTGFDVGNSAAANATLAGTAHFDGTGLLSGTYAGTFSATFENDRSLKGAAAGDLGSQSWSLYQTYVNTSGTGSTSLAADMALSAVSLSSGTGAGATLASFAAGVTGSLGANVTMSFTSGTAGQYSDILHLQGTDGIAQVLQLTYDPTKLGTTNAETLLLGWLDTRIGSTNGQWINSVLGNTGTNAVTMNSPFLGSWAKYASDNGKTAATALGAFGVDTTTNTVWAAVNHNSEFVIIVPEPGSLALAGLGIGLAGWSLWKRRRLARILRRHAP